MRTLTLTKQVIKDKADYTKNRLQVPLPKASPYRRYRLLLDDSGRMGILYGRGVRADEIQRMLVSLDPVGASVGAIMALLARNSVEPLYLALTGSLALRDHWTETSDVDYLLMVPDEVLSITKTLMKQLQPDIDVICLGASSIKDVGDGLDHMHILNARPIIDKVNLSAIVAERAVDWLRVKRYLSDELELLASYMEIVEMSKTQEERAECTPHILHRLRAVYLVDCLSAIKKPTKLGLTQCLAKYRISKLAIKKLYVSARLRWKNEPISKIPALSTESLLRICKATRIYGEDLTIRIGSKIGS